MTPAFDPEVYGYTATTSNASNTVTATAEDPNANIVISVDGVTLASGTGTASGSASWTSGMMKAVGIDVTNGSETQTYTVAVTAS